MTTLTMRVPEPGDVIAGKYRLSGVLGRGGMGIVFDGYHELLERKVAIKVLAPEVLSNREAVARFMNEARAAAKITSERVVHVLDVGILDGGLPFMVMERLEGLDVGQLLERQGLLPVAITVDLLLEAIEGVAHAHVEGIIHRDLKPSNLFVARRPDGVNVVKVLDFGISKLTNGAQGGNVTSTGAVLGSPLYMSPEQLRTSRSVDARTDIWSLGVIAYELLTRAHPFEGDSLAELFVAILEREARPLYELRSEVSRDLDEVVRRCLRRKVNERFASAFALGSALVPFGTNASRVSLERLRAHLSSRVQATLADESLQVGEGFRQGEVPGTSPAVGIAFDPSAGHATRPSGSSAPSRHPTPAPWSSTRSGSPSLRPLTAAGVIVAALGGGVLVWSGVVGLSQRSNGGLVVASDPPPPASSNTVVPNTVVPNTVVPNTVVPNTVVSNTVVPNTVVSNTVVPNTVVPAPASVESSPVFASDAGVVLVGPEVMPSARPAVSPAATKAVAAPTRGPTPPRTEPNCNVPYTLDSKGNKKWKPECL